MGEHGYLRVLGRFDGTMLVIGSIIGAGVFFTPNDIAQLLRDPVTMTLVWVIGGGIALTGSLTYAELGGLFPQAGGVYVFLREAFGPIPAFLYGWTVLLVIAPGALALVASFFAANLATLFPGLPTVPVALATILLLTAVNVRGVRQGATVQNVFTMSKLAALALLAVGGLVYTGDPLPAPAAASVPAPEALGVGAVLAALLPVMFSYGGWQNGTYIAAELRHPRRDVPFTVVVGTLVVIACYVLINVSYLRVLEPEVMAVSRTFASEAAEQALGPIGGLVVTVGILVSTFGICAAILLTNPRVAQAVAADGSFFPAFGRLHPRFRTPHLAIVVLGLWACVLLLVGRAGELLAAVVFCDWVFFAATAATLFLFRKRLPDAERSYRCHGYPWAPAVFLTLATGIAIVAFVQADTTSRILGPGILAAGVPVYYLFRARGSGAA